MSNDDAAGEWDPGLEVSRPSLLQGLYELRFPVEVALLLGYAAGRRWPVQDGRHSRSVMLIPGFLAGDVTLLPLASFCRLLGYKVVFAGIWSNSRCPRETVEHLTTNLLRLRTRLDGARPTVIGQSLGGIYARVLAARLPDSVERVITLGSPIRNVIDSSNPALRAAARWVQVMRRKEQGCLTESCSCGIRMVERLPDEVPVTAVYSRSDGVVHWQSCVDRSGSPAVENVEVAASHLGMALNPNVYRVIAERLAIPPRASKPRVTEPVTGLGLQHPPTATAGP